VPAVPDGPNPSGPLTSAQASHAILRGAVVPTVVVGVIAVALGALLRGSNGALGAAVGALIAISFFAAGQYAIDRILAGKAELAMASALLVYMTQILVLFLLIAVLKNATWLDSQVFAATIIACTITWIVASVWVWNRTKVLYVEPDPSVFSVRDEADQ
jgi:ATP synthase protein I